MICFLKKQKEPHAVLFDDINRLAREVVVHWMLKWEIEKAGGVLEALNHPFGKGSDDILVENMLASVSHYHRQKNAEQALNRMRARLLNGFWPFRAPIGYRHESHSGSGKVLVRDEPLATIVQTALAGFASGRFQTQAEVRRFLEAHPQFPKDWDGVAVRQQRVYEMLTRLTYCARIENASWGVSFREANHEGLISYETFCKIQERLASTAKTPARKDTSSDFPFRGFVRCADCGTALTACWSASRTGKKHPYYLCRKKGCPSYRKSIRRAQIETDLEGFIQALEPRENVFELATAMFKDAWEERRAQCDAITKDLEAKLKRLQKDIESFLARIVEASNASVIAAYEEKISKLEADKALTAEQIENSAKPMRPFEESFELAMTFLSRPWTIWKNGDLAVRKTVLRLAFSQPVAYCRNRGVRTPETAFPFKVLEAFSTAGCEMVQGRERKSNTL